MKKILALLLLNMPLLAFPAIQWQPLMPGLHYSLLQPDPLDKSAQIHVFKISLAKFRLNLVAATEQRQQSAYVADMGSFHDALIAVNGGFFTPELKPLGLRIKEGKTINPIRQTNWWGVFSVNKNNVAAITSKNAYRSSNNTVFAIQAGPRLIVNNAIPKLKEGEKERSALGITRNGDLILLVTQGYPISTTDLAFLMQKPEQQDGFACVNALNLDGGSSTQLYANIGHFKLNILSFRPVADAIIVKPR